jgi:hypothetical protein
MENGDFEILLNRIEELERKLDGHADVVADKAAAKVWELIYVEVGRNTIRGALWVIGIGCLVLAAWLAGTGRVSIK